MRVKPITPSEVSDKRLDLIPDEVIQAFNELIVETFDGVKAKFTQDKVIDRIMMKKMDISRQTIFDNHWLDVEPLYAAYWNPEYDKPGYNETYEAAFIFTKR